MNLLKKYPILVDWLSPFRLSQQKTFIALISALCQAAQANSFAIASEPASQTEIQMGSALNRLYRFLRNEGFDNWLLTERLFEFFAQRRVVLLCLDWTQWQDKFHLLTASVCVEKRSIAVAVSACVKEKLARSQRIIGKKHFWLCALKDCGQRRSKPFGCAIEDFTVWRGSSALLQAQQEFAVRLQGNLLIHRGGQTKLLKNIEMKPGQIRDFGFLNLRFDGAVRVRLIGVWADNSKEVWWIATNLTKPVSQIVGLYDRRMAIEEQFRDAKGVRFGLKMKWTCFEKSEYLERMYLLVSVAMLLWTSIGRVIENENPKVRLRCKTKGARLSLLRIGILFWRKATASITLTTKFIKANLPKPKVRIFKWIDSFQN